MAVKLKAAKFWLTLDYGHAATVEGYKNIRMDYVVSYDLLHKTFVFRIPTLDFRPKTLEIFNESFGVSRNCLKMLDSRWYIY